MVSDLQTAIEDMKSYDLRDSYNIAFTDYEYALGLLLVIPVFHSGGLVSGPTTALIGEGRGTSIANPEVVAPLNKLKSYMGGGNNIEVTGKLIGTDIYLSNNKTANQRIRTT